MLITDFHHQGFVLRPDEV